MAQRLETQYVHTRLVLTPREMTNFLGVLHTDGFTCHLCEKENGEYVVFLANASSQRYEFSFSKVQGTYIYDGPQYVTDVFIANAWRRVIALFRGDATALRVYHAYTIEYVYCAGRVQTITEITTKGRRTIYAGKEVTDGHAQLFYANNIEQEIATIRQQVDHALDERNLSEDVHAHKRIDAQLTVLAQRLFMYEA
jgi:hypothetical protein